MFYDAFKVSVMKLYNSASKQIEDFKSIEDGKVSLYACGPTVYHYAHIGNMRTYVFEDILAKTLRHMGYDVSHVMNITDVGHLQSDADDGDDKMAVAAAREQKSPWEVAKYYEEAFFKHSGLLNIARPNTVCRATDHIQEMIEMVKTLVEKGYAYESEGNVYFSVKAFPDYTKFANLKLGEQQSTDRVEHDPKKKDQEDFALWFSQSKFPNQIMKWDSPWGVGFPGWHIECSAMASKYLGDHFDIHCGGIDHIPVHHTNEIAQSECCHGHKWVNYWLHGEFLTMGEIKMSKSKGNILTVDTLKEEGFNPLAYRYFLLTAHYRSGIKFDFDLLKSAQTAYQGLLEKLSDWQKTDKAIAKDQLSEQATAYITEFWAHMANDLRSPAAIQTLWKMVKDSNISNAEKLSCLEDFDIVLSLNLSSQQEQGDNLFFPEAVQDLLNQRQDARNNKDWGKSDEIRDQLLEEYGIKVKDTANGQEWVKIA